MKLIVAISACMVCSLAAFAQKNTAKATATSRSKVRRTAIGGTILDARRQPVPKVQAFVYQGDVAVNASGFTDKEGYFETNSINPGTYNLRIVYPSAKRIVVSGIPVKGLKISMVDIATAQPMEDSAINYTDIAPATK